MVGSGGGGAGERLCGPFPSPRPPRRWTRSADTAEERCCGVRRAPRARRHGYRPRAQINGRWYGKFAKTPLNSCARLAVCSQADPRRPTRRRRCPVSTRYDEKSPPSPLYLPPPKKKTGKNSDSYRGRGGEMSWISGQWCLRKEGGSNKRRIKRRGGKATHQPLLEISALLIPV